MPTMAALSEAVTSTEAFQCTWFCYCNHFMMIHASTAIIAAGTCKSAPDAAGNCIFVKITLHLHSIMSGKIFSWNEVGEVCVCLKDKLGADQNGFIRGLSCNDIFSFKILIEKWKSLYWNLCSSS